MFLSILANRSRSDIAAAFKARNGVHPLIVLKANCRASRVAPAVCGLQAGTASACLITLAVELLLLSQEGVQSCCTIGCCGSHGRQLQSGGGA